MGLHTPPNGCEATRTCDAHISFNVAVRNEISRNANRRHWVPGNHPSGSERDRKDFAFII